MLRVILFATLLSALLCAAEDSDVQFRSRSPDGKFELVFDQMTAPPLVIREVSSGKPLMSMDEERFCGRGAAASWAPDSTKVVLIVHCRLADFIHVCRLHTDSIPFFQQTDGPALPEDRIEFGSWTSNSTLQLKGEKRVYTLRVAQWRSDITR